MTKNLFNVFVDADACPVVVRNALLTMAQSLRLKVLFVSSHNHKLREEGSICWVTVDADREAADMYIANRVEKGNIVVTQDTGLAALLLAKGVYVVSPAGFEYTENNIDEKLFSRYLSGKLRRAGKHVNRPKKYRTNDLQRFVTTIQEIVSKEGFL